MYKVGDRVIFGSYNVCEITAIGCLDMDGVSPDRLYYTMRPCYAKGSIIYTPVDNQKETIRPLLTKEEVLQLIDEMEDIDYLWVNDERKRERDYKDAIRSCDCRELIKIIKTIYMRRKKRTESGKAVTAIDKKYFSMAEDYLYGEWGIALGMDKESVKQYIIERMNCHLNGTMV